MKPLRINRSQLMAFIIAFAALPCFGQDGTLDRVAREVCLDIGIRAEISGLDDITLTTLQGDGENGATYSGKDTFYLESNAPVRLILSAAPVSNGLDTLPTDYRIDSASGSLETGGSGAHSGSHTLDVEAHLGAISDQLAGKYSSTLLITVVPQIPQISHCTETQVSSTPKIPSLPIEMEIESTLTEEKPLPAFNSVQLPAWANQIMALPDADLMFPYLAQYRQWLNGQLPNLSEQGQNWWLFPVDIRLLEELGINLLNR